MSEIPFTPPSLSELIPLFPAYEFQHLIAVGGMGAVYKATQISLDRTVAIKILPRKFGENKEFSEQFKTEAQTMAKVAHESLLGVLDFGTAGGLLYIVMEYAGNGSVHDLAFKDNLSLVDKIDIVLQATEGIAHAHEKGMLHRDIKPANLLLNNELRVKVGDFGLAKQQDADPQSGTIWGTPGYTAPEVILGPGHDSERSDIFSLGATLFFIVHKDNPPAEGLTLTALSGIDKAIAQVIKLSMAANPEHRFQSANEMANAIRICIDNINNPSKEDIIITASHQSQTTITDHTGINLNIKSAPDQQQPSPASAILPYGQKTQKLKNSNTGRNLLISISLIIAVIAVAYFITKHKSSKNKTLETPPVVETNIGNIPITNHSFENTQIATHTATGDTKLVINGWLDHKKNSTSYIEVFEELPAVDGNQAIAIYRSSLEYITNIHIKQGYEYLFTFHLASRSPKKIRPQRDFNISIMIDNLVVETLYPKDNPKRLINNKEFQVNSLNYKAVAHSQQYSLAPVKIKIESISAPICIDNITFTIKKLEQ